jgi:hypothetical protein
MSLEPVDPDFELTRTHPPEPYRYKLTKCTSRTKSKKSPDRIFDLLAKGKQFTTIHGAVLQVHLDLDGWLFFGIFSSHNSAT